MKEIIVVLKPCTKTGEDYDVIKSQLENIVSIIVQRRNTRQKDDDFDFHRGEKKRSQELKNIKNLKC